MENTRELKEGDSVHYRPFQGCDDSLVQNGVVKSVQDDQHAFVVYNCAGEWHRYRDYTAARTNAGQLSKGWFNHR